MQKMCLVTAISLLIVGGNSIIAQPPVLRGDYLEARSVNLYIGACHAQSEIVVGGREATLVWNFHRGDWNGVSLNNLVAVAVVSAKNNLEVDRETRRSALYLDARATLEQRAALLNLITTRRGSVVGEIVSTQIAPIVFNRQEMVCELRVGKVLSLAAECNPCEFCTQPHEVWYEPLQELESTIVGKSSLYRYEDVVLSVMWELGEPVNNIFLGDFTM